MGKPLIVSLSLALLSVPLFAQTYKTDIPQTITIPDTVETRLGTLHFKDGFPDDATVQKVYDNLDFERGVQANADRHARRIALRDAQRNSQLWSRQPNRSHL